MARTEIQTVEMSLARRHQQEVLYFSNSWIFF